MIDHTSVVVTNLDRAIAFYQKALAPLGYKLFAKYDQAAGFAIGNKPDFWISLGTAPASTHVAFAAKVRSEVKAFYAAAIAAGGADNGAPGVRPAYHPHYYGAFVHDPDGHNIEAVCHVPYLG